MDFIQDQLVQAAFTKGILKIEHLCFDTTQFESRDASKPSKKKETAPPHKKTDKAAWLAEQAEIDNVW